MLRSVLTPVVPLVVLLAGCSGGGDDPAAEDRTPEELLADAATTLEETSGVAIRLTTDDLPDGVTGIVEADGVVTRAPAFDGSITVSLVGQQLEVPVVAVDGTVHAQLPLSTGWQDIDPAEYGAPDPAGLVDPETGFSTLLEETTDVEEGETVRGGANNDEVLTEVSGTVPGTAVQNVIPSASGDFDATYTVTSEGELRSAELVGVFYADAPAMTYTVAFDQYGTEQEITAP